LRWLPLAIALAAAQQPATHVLQLAPGVVEVHSEVLIAPGTEVRGAATGTVIRFAADFKGRAAFVVAGSGVLLHDFTIDGNRDALERRTGLPPSNLPFAEFTTGSGILAQGATDLRIERIAFRNIAGFAVLVSKSRRVLIDRVRVTNSGSRNEAGRNNTTGGILLEEGTADFQVTRCELTHIRGNGIWTHSLFTSSRNSRGLVALNRFDALARDAIQAGHATEFRIEDNFGVHIGYPAEEIDIESQATPVGIDTAGDVDRSSYARNTFRDVAGKCIDLDGFHDGDVTANRCTAIASIGILFNDSNPNTRSKNIRMTGNVLDGVGLTGIYTFGTGHIIANNRLLNVNYTHSEVEGLDAGIYLGKGFLWLEPAHGNVIRGNEITGYKMNARCVVSAPGVDRNSNRISANDCR